MFSSIGVPEVVLVFLVVILLFGPNKLPTFAKTFGKALMEFRRAYNSAKATIEKEIQQAEIAREVKEAKDSIEKQIKEAEISQEISQARKFLIENVETADIYPAPSPVKSDYSHQNSDNPPNNYEKMEYVDPQLRQFEYPETHESQSRKPEEEEPTILIRKKRKQTRSQEKKRR